MGVKVMENVKYEFSELEKKELAEVIAQSIVQRDELTVKKKAKQSEMKADIDALEHKVSELSEKYNDGFEMREMEVYKELDLPNDLVRFIRPDTGEIVKERGLTLEERQGKLGLS